MALQDRVGLEALNAVGQGMMRLGLPVAGFDVEQLERMAQRRTGLSTFGSLRYREPLRRLCESYAEDEELTFFGRLVCRGTLIHLLSNRLMIQRDLQADPGIEQEMIRAPIFVVGLPRTGTTLLFNMLAQDVACRPLMFWESAYPSPPPRPETYHSDARIRRARRTVRGLNRALPELAGIHEFRADAPEECLGLIMNAFLTPFFRGRIPSYRQWLDEIAEAEIDAAYAEYRQQLQLLQRHVKKGHWLLKCPCHLFGLGGLLSNFPDAAIVQTHRSLAQSIPSLCSLTATVEQLCYRRIDLREIGRRSLRTVEQLLFRGLRGRDRQDVDGRRVLDVAYEELLADPAGTVKRIYRHFGYEYTAEFDQRLLAFLRSDSREGKALHSYSLDMFGLTEKELGARFAGYQSRFGIASER